jgi:hypothetical protein
MAISIGVLQVGTVILLARGPARKYVFVLAYSCLQIITSLTEVVVAQKFGPGSKLYRLAFWTDELVLDVLLFFILILLTYRAMEGSPVQGAMARMLGAVALVVLALPFVLFRGAFLKTSWFDHTSQMLNFGAAILNLGLWTALLGSGKRDAQLLTVSAGFGILATGVAICFGLRRLVHGPGLAFTAANMLFVAAHLSGALILCWAFRPGALKTAGIDRTKLPYCKPKPYPPNKGFA